MKYCENINSQHIKIEDPGYIKDLMIKDGADLTTIELDEGKNSMISQSLMPCFVWEDQWIHGWKKILAIEEKKRIKEFVIDLKSIFGIVLAVSLGEVVGGKVVKSNKPEIGMLDINFYKIKV